MAKKKRNIDDLLFEPAHRLLVLLAEPVSKSWLENLCFRAQKFAVVEVLLAAKITETLRKDPFIGPFLAQMALQGVVIKELDDIFEGVHLIVDQKKYWSAKTTAEPFEMQSVSEAFFENNVLEEVHDRCNKDAKTLFPQSITEPSVRIQPARAIKGESFRICWNAPEWTEVQFPDGYTAQATGERSFVPKESGSMVVSFRKEAQYCYQQVSFELLEGLEIHAGIRVQNVLTKSWMNLEPEDAEQPFFAVQRGQEVEFYWEVPHADFVRIEPLGLQSHSGSYRLSLQDAYTFSIQAQLSKQQMVKEFQLIPYPVALSVPNHSFDISKIFSRFKDRFGEHAQQPNQIAFQDLDTLRKRLEENRVHLLKRWRSIPKMKLEERTKLREQVLKEHATDQNP